MTKAFIIAVLIAGSLTLSACSTAVSLGSGIVSTAAAVGSSAVDIVTSPVR